MLFKGAGPGTHWHANNAQATGFTLPGAITPTVNVVVNHITAFSAPSAYCSFSLSFAIARGYAIFGPGGVATKAAPGLVYQIDLSALSALPALVDPVLTISRGLNGQYAHGHNGGFLALSEIAQTALGPGGYTPTQHVGGGTCPLIVTSELQALVRAIRDAEILVQGNVPAGAIIKVHQVY